MKIVFISNFLTHHQRPFLEALNAQEDVSCLFIEMEQMPEHRKQLGYREQKCPFAVSYSEVKNRMEALLRECDVLISGGVYSDFIRIANRWHKTVFVFSERLFKDKEKSINNFLRIMKYRRYAHLLKNAYLLCASGFACADYETMGLFRSRAYVWGYFPPFISYQADSLMQKKEHSQIIWCGRFLSWKHYEDAIEVAGMLRDRKYHFSLLMIGVGEMLEDARRLVAEHHLDNYVRLLGSMPSEEVRKQMERSGIFLLTSDRREGWGAVLNEAMNSGCASVASDAAGAVPVLLRHGENGLVYPSGNTHALFECVSRLLDSVEEREQLGKNAYFSISEQWNPSAAAKRFVILSRHLSEKRKGEAFSSGICAKAEPISNDWFVY